MMTPGELGSFINEHFTRTAYRWEALPAYEVASDGNDYSRYLEGKGNPDYARTEPWREKLRTEKARGLYRHRVRLLHDPLHPYERYECEWGYVPNAACGETIRVLHVGEHEMPADMVDHDYWLIDDQHAIRMHYGDVGEFLGATLEPDLVDVCRAARDRAWAAAEPFSSWWGSHPELHRDQYDGDVA